MRTGPSSSPRPLTPALPNTRAEKLTSMEHPPPRARTPRLRHRQARHRLPQEAARGKGPLEAGAGVGQRGGRQGRPVRRGGGGQRRHERRGCDAAAAGANQAGGRGDAQVGHEHAGWALRGSLAAPRLQAACINNRGRLGTESCVCHRIGAALHHREGKTEEGQTAWIL